MEEASIQEAKSIAGNPFASSQVEPPELDPEELRAPGAVGFGTRRSYWISLFVAAGLIGCVGLYFLALSHSHDPARERAQETSWVAFVMFLGAIFFVARGAWFSLAQLWVTSRWIAQKEFGLKAIQLADVSRIVWRVDWRGDFIEIHGPARFIRIRLETLRWKDQNALVAIIRRAFPSSIQSGWSHAFERRLSCVESQCRTGANAPRDLA